MGIKSLMKLIQDYAPGCVKLSEMKAYFNRTVAIDASTSLYQFLVAVRQADGGGR
jgi:flap endonuclease-1